MKPAKPLLDAVRLLPERVPSFDEYPYSIPAIRHLRRLPLHPHVTFFVGENGTGKSTLLEAIAGAEGLNLEGGSRNYSFSTHDNVSTLKECLRLERSPRRLARTDAFFFRAESFYNVATEAERLELASGNGSWHRQSHGEAFLSLVQDRFRGDGLYLLDESEAALSPLRQLAFLAATDELVRAGSQLIIATHSPLVMAYPLAQVYWFSESGIAAMDYKDTQHYRTISAFLDNPERMLSQLLPQCRR